MSDIRAAGFIVFRRSPTMSFLLMKHKDRWDLPKGHVDAGETDFVCARRELQEETGIEADEIVIDERFEFVTEYIVREKRHKFRPLNKTLKIYLGWLEGDREIVLTEHVGYKWFDWAPPHAIQEQTIDGLLAYVQDHFEKSGMNA